LLSIRRGQARTDLTGGNQRKTNLWQTTFRAARCAQGNSSLRAGARGEGCGSTSISTRSIARWSSRMPASLGLKASCRNGATRGIVRGARRTGFKTKNSECARGEARGREGLGRWETFPPVTLEHLPSMKNESAAQRIRMIRSRVREERQLVSKLNGVVTDANLRRMLRLPVNMLDRVETFFLNPKILQEDRSPAALARWLREAERILQLASQQSPRETTKAPLGQSDKADRSQDSGRRCSPDTFLLD
jgi:hypothetical protein